jgi:hypothetical protein
MLACITKGKNMMSLLKALPFFVFTVFASANPEVIISPVDHLYVPKGFDNNDNVELVVTGNFPNPCYIKNTSVVEVIGDKIHVTVTALKKDDPSHEICAAMTVPFSANISIGNLQGGDYQVIVNENSPFEQKKIMTVEVSPNNSMDDHLYPIIEYVDLGFMGGLSGEATILAKSPSDCMVFDRVEYLSNEDDTLSILPIMKKVSNTCNKSNKIIEIPVKFNLKEFKHEKVLLFVRSLEGTSVNQFIQK